MIQQIVKSTDQTSGRIEMFEVTDPEELAAAAVRRGQFDRNSAWLQAHIDEILRPPSRGKFLCIAGEEAFVGDYRRGRDRTSSSGPSRRQGLLHALHSPRKSAEGLCELTASGCYCLDGDTRPVVRGEILLDDGNWLRIALAG